MDVSYWLHYPFLTFLLTLIKWSAVSCLTFKQASLVLINVRFTLQSYNFFRQVVFILLEKWGEGLARRFWHRCFLRLNGWREGTC